MGREGETGRRIKEEYIWNMFKALAWTQWQVEKDRYDQGTVSQTKMEINSCQPVLDEILESNDYPLYPDYCWNWRRLNDVSSRPFPRQPGNRLGMPDVYVCVRARYSCVKSPLKGHVAEQYIYWPAQSKDADNDQGSTNLLFSGISYRSFNNFSCKRPLCHSFPVSVLQ